MSSTEDERRFDHRSRPRQRLDSPTPNWVFAWITYFAPGIHEYMKIVDGSCYGAICYELVTEIRDLDGCVYDLYSDYLDIADYPDLSETLGEIKLQPASTSSEDDSLDIEVLRATLHNLILNCQDLRAVKAKQLEDLVELFNYITGNGLADCPAYGSHGNQSDPLVHIELLELQEFAPLFLGWLARSLEMLDRTYVHPPSLKPFLYLAESFRPFQSHINDLLDDVQDKEWPQSDVAFGRFLELVRLFETVAEQDH